MRRKIDKSEKRDRHRFGTNVRGKLALRNTRRKRARKNGEAICVSKRQIPADDSRRLARASLVSPKSAMAYWRYYRRPGRNTFRGKYHDAQQRVSMRHFPRAAGNNDGIPLTLRDVPRYDDTVSPDVK